MKNNTLRTDVAASDSGYAIVSAVNILKEQYPGRFNERKNQESKASSRRFYIVSSVILAVVAAGWFRWNYTGLSKNFEFVYDTGLAGGLLMLLALTYSFRKRFAVLRKAGKIESWYYVHLFGGILGPFIIIFHTSFAIKSVNSLIAIICMLCIVFSGALGRFFYTRLSFLLHGKLERIDKTEVKLFQSLEKYNNDVIHRHLSRLTLTCLTQPKSIFHIPYAYILVRLQAGACYVTVGDQIARILQEVARRSGWSYDNYSAALLSEKRILQKYIRVLIEISVSRSFEQMLNKWRLLHAPMMYLLLICTLGHIYVVHAY